MSNVAFLRSESPRPSVDGVRLQPATVTALHADGSLDVRFADEGTGTARMALPIPYRACVGDSLLTIRDAEACWVIGVVAGAGRVDLELPGDVSIRAVGGALRLGADREVRIEAPELSVTARKVAMVADAVVQRFATLRQRVLEVMDVHAGESRTTVDGTAYTQATNATVLTREAVVINGKAIHLG